MYGKFEVSRVPKFPGTSFYDIQHIVQDVSQAYIVWGLSSLSETQTGHVVVLIGHKLYDGDRKMAVKRSVFNLSESVTMPVYVWSLSLRRTQK